MHGKVWMFSHLIDDEDIEFMQHEFITINEQIQNIAQKKDTLCRRMYN